MPTLRIGLRLDAMFFTVFAAAVLAFGPASRTTAQTITIDPHQ